ncbi:hypothetical protein LTS18_013996, partial [Coniosporium uncinatum]
MADGERIEQFPDLTNKLTAPTKKSAFERQKAEAEAKRAREEAENAAALEEFAASFGGDEEDAENFGAPTGPGGHGFGRGGGAPGGVAGPPRRHFAPTG